MITLFFVVDGAGLQAQSALLAATLARHNGTAYRLVAYSPPEKIADIPSPLRDLYDRCQVELSPIAPDTGSTAGQFYAKKGWARPYPHGNKILAAATPRKGDWGVFLDTDMICAAPLDLAAMTAPNRLALVPEGVATWGAEPERWPLAYGYFNLPVPEEKVRLTRRGRKENLPYFNGGLVMFPEAPPPGQEHGFGPLWLDTALDFDWYCRLPSKRPWLDQISLPLTIKRFGYEYLVAPVELNFSISDRAYEPAASPSILHYHRWRYLHGWPQGAEAFRDLAQMAGPALLPRLQETYADLQDQPPVA